VCEQCVNNCICAVGGRGKQDSLVRSSDWGVTWKVIYSCVYTFGMEGKFLYTSAFLPLVSTDFISGIEMNVCNFIIIYLRYIYISIYLNIFVHINIFFTVQQ